MVKILINNRTKKIATKPKRDKAPQKYPFLKFKKKILNYALMGPMNTDLVWLKHLLQDPKIRQNQNPKTKSIEK